MRGTGLKWLLVVGTGLVFVLQFLPILVIVVFSFNASRSVSAFTGFSLRWYEKLFANTELFGSLLLSARIAFLCALITVVLSVPLALAISRLPKKEGLVPGAIVALVFTTPEIAMGVSLLLLFTSFGVQLSSWTIVLGHVTFSLSFGVLVTRSRLGALSRSVEEAGMDLGASRLGVLVHVILPQLLPGIWVTFALVFLLSFDDFVVSFFTSGVRDVPLPVYIYGMMKRGVSPEVNAIGTLMVTVVVLVVVALLVVARRRGHTKEIVSIAKDLSS